MDIFAADAKGSRIERVELARQAIAAAGGMAIGSGFYFRDIIENEQRQKDKAFRDTLSILLQLATQEQINALHKGLDDLQKRLDEEFEKLEQWRTDIERRTKDDIAVSDEERKAYERRARQLAEIQTDVIDAGRDTLNGDHVTVDQAKDLQDQIRTADEILDSNPMYPFAEAPKPTPLTPPPASMIFNTPSV